MYDKIILVYFDYSRVIIIANDSEGNKDFTSNQMIQQDISKTLLFFYLE